MAENKRFLSVLSKTAVVGLIVAAASSPVLAKPAAIDVNGTDGKVYEYQYQPLRDSAVAAVLNGAADPSAKLYTDFAQRKVTIKAFYDDVRNAYVDFDVISKAAIDAATSDGTKTFNFTTFTEDTTVPTITVTPNKVTIDANGNIAVGQAIGNNADLSDGSTHTSDYAISTLGTFGSADATKTTTINGNISINNASTSATDSITLQNLNINGTLTVDFGSGSLKLYNVKVNGVNISDVGSHSADIDGNSSVGILNINDRNHDAHVVVRGNASIASTTVLTGASLEVAAGATNAHPFASVTISPTEAPSASNAVTLAGGTFGSVTVDRPANVAVASGATLQSISANSDLALSGAGTVASLTVNSAGANVNLQVPSIGTLLVNSGATGAAITVPSGTTVGTLNANAPVSVTGTGAITTANLGVSGTTMQTRPTNVAVVAGVTATVGGQVADSSNSTVITSVPTDSTPATPATPATPVTPGGGSGGGTIDPITGFSTKITSAVAITKQLGGTSLNSNFDINTSGNTLTITLKNPTETLANNYTSFVNKSTAEQKMNLMENILNAGTITIGGVDLGSYLNISNNLSLYKNYIKPTSAPVNDFSAFITALNNNIVAKNVSNVVIQGYTVNKVVKNDTTTLYDSAVSNTVNSVLNHLGMQLNSALGASTYSGYEGTYRVYLNNSSTPYTIIVNQ